MKKGNSQLPLERRLLRRRSSSLTDMTESSAPPINTLRQVKKMDDDQRRASSPDLNAVDMPAQEGTKSERQNEKPVQSGKKEGDIEEGGQVDVFEGEKMEKKGASQNITDPSNNDRISVSTVESAVSAVSGDDVETVIDEDEKESPQVGRKTKRSLLSSSDLEGDQELAKVEGSLDRSREHLSASCSTIENEKQESEERESSDEPQRRHQMSLSFRQELLTVCQLKTDPKLDGEVVKLASPGLDVVQMLGRTLPHILPLVVHNKREVWASTWL